MTTAKNFQYIGSRKRAFARAKDPVYMQRLAAVAIIIIVVSLAAVAVWNSQQRAPAPVQPQFAVLDCAALDVDLDGVPDVLSCGGAAFSLSPFEGGE